MNNKLVYITKDEAEQIKNHALNNEDVFLAEIEGAKIRTEVDYVQEMSNAFAFPHELPAMKIGWSNDYISDLMWIEQKDIVLLIHNYDLMLCDEQKLKKNILDDFEEIILPWWESEVIGRMIGGMPRGFIVYLEQSAK